MPEEQGDEVIVGHVLTPKFAQIEINNIPVRILNVPYIEQPPQMLCFPYSVSMVIDYFRRTENIGVPNLSPADLISILNTDPERGTVLSNATLKKLSEYTTPIEFARYRGGISKLDECFEDKIPPILIFNAMYYFVSEEGPAHATVYLGRTDTKIITNNPWMGMYYPYDLEKFLEAWEIENYEIVIPRIRKIEDTKLNNFLSTDEEVD